MGTWKLLDAFLYMAWIPGLGQPPAETCAQTLLIIKQLTSEPKSL